MKIEWDENDDFCGMRVLIRGKENEQWIVSFTNHVVKGFDEVTTIYGLTSSLDGMTVYSGSRKQLVQKLNDEGYIPVSKLDQLHLKR